MCIRQRPGCVLLKEDLTCFWDRPGCFSLVVRR